MRATEAAQLLRRRVASIDSRDRSWATSSGAAGLIEHTISVVAARTYEDEDVLTGYDAALEPAEADNIVGRCETLTELGRLCPEIVDGPLQFSRQQWIGTARHTGPDPAAFRAPPASAAPSPNPFDVGLYTSSTCPVGRGSWSIYLQQLYVGSDLFPLPWNAWDLPVQSSARVREIASARDWTNLIEEFPLIHAGAAYPDWTAITTDYDAVHPPYGP